MQHELQELQPVLAATAKEVEGMMQVITHDKDEAAETKRIVEQQEREANEQAAAAKAIAGNIGGKIAVQHVLHSVTPESPGKQQPMLLSVSLLMPVMSLTWSMQLMLRRILMQHYQPWMLLLLA